MAAGAGRDSVSDGADAVEHALVVDRLLEIEIADSSSELGPGDLISFGADRPHRYRSVGSPVRIVGIHHYPRGRTAFAPSNTERGVGV